MIPTMADDDMQEVYVRNIRAVWGRATDDQLARGRQWYRTANDIAEFISGGDTKAGAGVLAALSPQKAWPTNVRLATEAFENGEARGQVQDAVAKAERIMLGEEPLLVLPEDSKTYNFYRAILDPDDPDPVVIDRHAHDVAAGERYGERNRGLSNKNRYATLAHAYREAARRMGEIPSTVQAVTWVVWKEERN
jgi:hypothetical protein